MSTLFVNTIKPNSGDTVTLSGSLTTTGKLTIGDESGDILAITAEVSSSIIPDTNNTFDLGSSAKQWKDLYVDGIAYIDSIGGADVVNIGTASFTNITSSLIPGNDDALDLGSSIKQWKNLYIDGIAYIDQIGALGAPVILPLISSSVTVDGSVLPSGSGTFSLGSLTQEWNYLYANNIGEGVSIPSISSSVNISGSIIPNGDDVHNLGSSVKQWKNLYINGTADIDHLSTTSASIGNILITDNSISTVAGTDLNITPIAGQQIVLDGNIIIDSGSITGVSTLLTTAGTLISASGQIISPGNIEVSSYISASEFRTSGNISSSKNISASGELIISNITASGYNGVFGGNISASGDITADNVTSVGTGSFSHVKTTGNVSASGYVYADRVFLNNNDVVRYSSANSGLYVNGGIQTIGNSTFGNGSNDKHEFTGSVDFQNPITASNDLNVSGAISAHDLTLTSTAASSQDLASSLNYNVNGSKVDVKAITAANIADGAFAEFFLLNTSIASNSVVFGNFTGGTAGLITGSILTIAVIGTSTASIQIHNETGAQIDADTGFTASFAVIG